MAEVVVQSNLGRIINTLVTRVKDHKFAPVTRASDGSFSAGYDDADSSTWRSAQRVLCNEIDATFELDDNDGRGISLQRAGMILQLKMHFSGEVLLEDFENSLMSDPPHVAADSALGLPFVRLFLDGKTVDHPVQEQGTGGTEVVYRFVAQEGRR